MSSALTNHARATGSETSSARSWDGASLTAGSLAVGQQVFCPRHGIGIVRERRQRQVLGHRRDYLTIDLAQPKMRIMLPADGALRAGLRLPSQPAEAAEALSILGSAPEEMSPNWRTRTKEHAARLSTGRLDDIAMVVRNLTALEREGSGLAATERELYHRAKELLLGDLMAAFGLDELQAEARLQESLPGQ